MAEEKYLTYDPWPGNLNNTRMCLETVLLLAVLTRRILVLPDGYHSGPTHSPEGLWLGPPDPAAYFDFSRLAEVATIRRSAECGRELARVPADARRDLVIEPGKVVFCSPRIPRDSPAEWLRLREFAAGRRVLLENDEELRQCRILHIGRGVLEHFYAFFFFLDDEEYRRHRALIRDHLRYRRGIIEQAARITSALGSFSAVLVRRNEFLGLYPQQDVSATRIAESLRDLIATGSRLLVATDEPDRRFFAALERRYELCFVDDLLAPEPDARPGQWNACVAQVACSHAEVFVGTKLSTMSSYVTRLRGYRGTANREVYFTDGSPGSAMDGVGHPAFSWQNWLRAGNPLWGREFKEGWEI